MDPEGLQEEALDQPPKKTNPAQGGGEKDTSWMDATPGLIPKGYLREDEKAALKENVAPKLQEWGKTMLLCAPWEVSVAQELKKDGPSWWDVPRGIWKSIYPQKE